MKLLRRRRARDLAIVVAVVALGAVALTDALRGRTTEEARDGRAVTAATTDAREASATTAEEPQDGQTSTTTTDEGEASAPRLPGRAASGLLVFTVPGGCELRAIDLRSGRRLDIPRLETNCELWAPRVGTRVAYSVHDDWGTSKKHFSILDLEKPRARFGDYLANWIAWSPDGSTLAWCDSVGSGFELSRGQRPKHVDQCPSPDPALPWDANLAPDNCAALLVRGDVAHLDDLGCFQGRAPQTFKGLYADWSPNGKWIVVAEPDAVVFHRVVGREASVRWNVVAGQLAWLSG